MILDRANPRLKRLAELFDRFKDGDEDALIAVLEGERPYLFDYIFRLTGDLNRAQDSLDEVCKAVSSQVDHYQTYTLLRQKLYLTARSFNGDAWNADTSQLQNTALQKLRAEAMDDDDLRSLKHAEFIDQVIRALPGPDREIFCLFHVEGFSAEELAAMFKIDLQTVRDRITSLEARFCQYAGISPDDLPSYTGNIALHPLPERSQISTLALSQMIGGLDEAKSSLSGGKGWLIILLIIGVGAGLIAFFGLEQIAAWFRG